MLRVVVGPAFVAALGRLFGQRLLLTSDWHLAEAEGLRPAFRRLTRLCAALYWFLSRSRSLLVQPLALWEF
jgi:hypothetical protein